jgi:hypothetical protein
MAKKTTTKSKTRKPLEYKLTRKGCEVTFQITRQDGKVIKRSSGRTFESLGLIVASESFPQILSYYIFLRGSDRHNDSDPYTLHLGTPWLASEYAAKVRKALSAFNKHLMKSKRKKTN